MFPDGHIGPSVPQLVMPLSHDQPDNAERARKLGVARVLSSKHYTAERVIPLLSELLNNPLFKEHSRATQDRFEGKNPIADTGQFIESIS